MGAYEDEKFVVSTTIPKGHPLRRAFVGVKNKSKFARMYLGDGYKVNPDFKRYMSLPEKERLRAYFGVQPSMQEQAEKLLEELEGMMADEGTRQKLFLEAVYVAMFEPYKSVYAGEWGCPPALIKYFVSDSAGKDVKKLQAGGMADSDLFRSFSDSAAEFFCTYPPEKAALEEWEKKIQTLPAVEKTYIDLCTDLSTICMTGEILEGSPADYILGFMKEHLRGCTASGKNMHTAFFERMKEDCIGVFRKQAGALQRKAG